MGLQKFQDVTTILFDLDNTLINTKGADRLACEQVFQYLWTGGMRRSAARAAVDKFYALVRDAPHDPADEWAADVDAWRTALWRRALGPGPASRAPHAYRLWKETRAGHWKLSQELQDLLLELRRHYKLGVVTNGPSGAQWEKLRAVRADLFFDAILVSGDVRAAKPHAAIFEEAFRRLDCSSLECVMVGDNLDTDIRGAVRANCAATVWLDAGCDERCDTRCDEEGAWDFRISAITEIADLLPSSKGFSVRCRDKRVGLFHSLKEEGGWKSFY